MFEYLTRDFLCDSPTSAFIPEISHFGDLHAEIVASEKSAVVVPVSQLVRIRLTGRDRAKFLHNLCTNNVRDLQAGAACEAFFTDARARVIAHGWILAAAEYHEIWMFAETGETILKHLNRYIISEDVTVSCPERPVETIAILGPEIISMVNSAFSPESLPAAALQWIPLVSQPSEHTASALMILLLELAGRPVMLISVCDPLSTSVSLAETWQRLIDSGCTPAGFHTLLRLRILERLPRIGTDMTIDHMAPEADRNATAISYRKGCYLGQEPIARLDALGHINRAIRTLRIRTADDQSLTAGAEVQLEGVGTIGHVTSFCRDIDPEYSLGMGMIRIHNLNFTAGVTVLDSPGNSLSAEVLPPTSTDTQ